MSHSLQMQIDLGKNDLLVERGDHVGLSWKGAEVVCKHQGAFAEYWRSEGQRLTDVKLQKHRSVKLDKYDY